MWLKTVQLLGENAQCTILDLSYTIVIFTRNLVGWIYELCNCCTSQVHTQLLASREANTGGYLQALFLLGEYLVARIMQFHLRCYNHHWLEPQLIVHCLSSVLKVYSWLQATSNDRYSLCKQRRCYFYQNERKHRQYTNSTYIHIRYKISVINGMSGFTVSFKMGRKTRSKPFIKKLILGPT